MIKILMLSLGLMFSLYGYDYLLGEAYSEKAVHSDKHTPAPSFTHRISQKRG